MYLAGRSLYLPGRTCTCQVYSYFYLPGTLFVCLPGLHFKSLGSSSSTLTRRSKASTRSRPHSHTRTPQRLQLTSNPIARHLLAYRCYLAAAKTRPSFLVGCNVAAAKSRRRAKAHAQESGPRTNQHTHNVRNTRKPMSGGIADEPRTWTGGADKTCQLRTRRELRQSWPDTTQSRGRIHTAK